MVTKWLKKSVIMAGVGAMAAGLFFGKDAVSYVKSSAKSVRTAVKDNVPIEFELKRATDLLEDIIPEMHANIRLIAEEEIEIAALKTELQKGQEALSEEKHRISTLKAALAVQKASYTFGNRSYSRDTLKTDLIGRFDRFKEAEIVYTSKERLLTTREQSLQSAMSLLDKTKSQKQLLQNKISALEGRYRLNKAASVGTRISIDNSKLAQTEKLIAQIKKRLDIADRVLAHETKFVQSIDVDVMEEADLIAQIDDHFNTPDESADPANHHETALAIGTTTPAVD